MVDDKDREARRILGRVDAETEARMAPRQNAENDWAELWGRRIARALSLVLLVVLIWWLWGTLAETAS